MARVARSRMVTPADPSGAAFAGALAHVECLPLGDSVIAHNRESGAMVATNAFGAMLIDHLRATPDAAAVVRTIAATLDQPEAAVRGAVEATLARWSADGIFLTAQRPFPTAAPYRPVAAGTTRHLSLDARAVTVASEDATLVEDLDRALAPLGLEQERPFASGRPLRLDVLQAGAGYGVFRNGAPVWGVASYELTRFHLLREIMDGLIGPERVAAQLHASAVSLAGRALIFSGASGSGKSTLATVLVGEGAVQAADDHVALATEGHRLFAFPTRPNLKPGAAALPELRAFVEVAGAEAGGDRTAPRVPVGTALDLAAFVFPSYAPDAENMRVRLTPEAALRELIQTGSRVSRTARSIAPLLAALENRPSWRLTYRDSAFACNECRALVAG